MVTVSNFRRTFNSEELAKKDPFSLGSIEVLKDFDKIVYYTGIVSSFILKIIQSHPSFKYVRYQPCGTFAVGRYYSNGDELLAREYSANRDSERFRKGDTVIETAEPSIDEKTKRLFEIMREISSHNLTDIPTPKTSLSDLQCNFATDVLGFSYFAREGTNPFFIFDFYHPKERKRVIRSLEDFQPDGT